MPITPSAIKKRKTALRFTYGDDPVNVEYYPASLGPETVSELQAWMDKASALRESQDREAVHAALVEFGAWICTLLASWDYLEDPVEGSDQPGPMVPITPERLAEELERFPDFIVAVLLAIIRDRSQGNASGTASSAPSGATSSPMESSASSPMGPSLTPSDSSSSPDGSRELPALNG